MAQRTFVVIGAGIIGCLTASELAARDPSAQITVVDQDAAGTGASRRSAGLHLPRGSTARVREMSARSHAYYAGLRRSRPDLPIRQVRATVISSVKPSEHGYLDLAAPAPAAPAPGVAMGTGQSAWRLEGCHHADVSDFCQRMAAQLRPRVRFAEGVQVTGLTATGDGVTVTAGTGEQLTADHVVLAPGPWLAAPAWADLIAVLGLRVKKIVALHVDRPARQADEVIVFDDEDAFLLPLPGRGHWLFSYTCQEWDVDPDRLSSGLSAANVTAATEILRRYCPAMAGAAGSGRVFCDAYSPAAEPVVHSLDETGRIVFAGAANGSGYRLAPAIAAEAADLIGLVPSEGVTGDHQHV